MFSSFELGALPDYQRLERMDLSLSDKKKLVHHLSFFQFSKTNEVLKGHHSSLIDKILGLRVKYIEDMLLADTFGFDLEAFGQTDSSNNCEAQTWLGLNPDVLQTPYSDCLKILQFLKIKPYQTLIDLGAAYGRMGVVIGGVYLKNEFIGYECVRSRVEEGNRIYRELGFQRCKLVEQDLFAADFELPAADVYFIYDYGQVHHIERTLIQVRQNALKGRPAKVVVRGKFTKKMIEERHHWLESYHDGKTDEAFSVYLPRIS
jgi:precorrin-6B methylase 2